MAPVILSLIQCSRPVSCAEKHDATTPMLHSRDGVLGLVLIILLPPNMISGIMTKKLYFGHI